MLISITEKCRMNCPHCMDDARSDSSKFMSFDTFKKAVEFNDRYDISTTITGGEPTEHPEFWDFLRYCIDAKDSDHLITVVTNGMNLETDPLADTRINDLANIKPHVFVKFQVTNVPDLYPIKIDLHKRVFRNKNVVVCTDINEIYMYPQGRALNKDYDFSNTKAPKCFNIRSSIRATGSIYESVCVLRRRMKFCTPQIAYDGSIKVGESTLCPRVSHIDNDENKIIDDINNFRCSSCKIAFDKLDSFHRHAIGEE